MIRFEQRFCFVFSCVIMSTYTPFMACVGKFDVNWTVQSPYQMTYAFEISFQFFLSQHEVLANIHITASLIQFRDGNSQI